VNNDRTSGRPAKESASRFRRAAEQAHNIDFGGSHRVADSAKSPAREIPQSRAAHRLHGLTAAILPGVARRFPFSAAL